MKKILSIRRKIWIRKRDKNKCQLCHNKGTQCHHIVSISEAKSKKWSRQEINSPYNVILLCENCHKKAHMLNLIAVLSRIAIENTRRYKIKCPKDIFR